MIIVFIDWFFLFLYRPRMSVLLVYIQIICFDLNEIILEKFTLISFVFLFTLLFISILFYLWYHNHFSVYSSENLLGLSGHPLSGHYRTTHNMLSQVWVVTLGVREFVEDFTSTIDENISLYISGCKPNLISWFVL